MYPQEHYFKKHTLNTLPDVKLKNVDRLEPLPVLSITTILVLSFSLMHSVKKDEYELVIHSLFRYILLFSHWNCTSHPLLPLRQASVLDHSRDPCKPDFIPNTKVHSSPLPTLKQSLTTPPPHRL